jgi:tetratricopeptide (TPR) repeat protein
MWDSLDFRSLTEMRIDSFLESGEPDRAERLIRKELRKDPQDVRMLIAQAEVFRQSEQPGPALATLQEVVRFAPDEARAHFGIGRICAALGRDEEALRSFDRSIECGGGPGGSYLGRADVLLQMGRLDEALRTCELSLESNPNETSAVVLRGRILRDLDSVEEARAWLAGSITQDSVNTRLLHELWHCDYRLKNFAQALACSERILEITPMDAVAWHNKGEALFRMNRQREALACYLRAVTLQKDLYVAHTGIGVCHLLNRDYSQAIVHLQKALEISPDFGPAKANHL